MRKIFIDGGANRGQSTKTFLKQWPNSKEFEIFMFEPGPEGAIMKGLKSLTNEKIKLLPQAIWIYDGKIIFYEKSQGSEGNTLLKEKTSREKRSYKKREVDCVSLKDWIKNSFSKEDYIILKLDIEGAEYEVMKDMDQSGVFEYIDLFFCEIHGLKCGKSFDESMELIDICSKHNITPYCWDGNTFNYKKYKNKIYTKQHLTSEYDKWKKRGLK
tara:strand:- start:16 stop:657 length:642 start_codon:yes stop_codon:yes gene_type:complete